MNISIRVSEDMYQDAKRVARTECRTVANQIEFWARLGKCALENPELPIAFVQAILISIKENRSLAEPLFIENNADK